MEQNTSRRGERFLKKYKFWKRWQKAVTAMACVVVFCTTYALILPAITLENHVYCGKEEHAEHSVAAGCYSVEKVLICGITEKGNHKHKDSCYEYQDVLICNLEEKEGHTHDDSCYEIVTHLSCGREESAGHHHSESCYDEEGNLTCSQAESDGHSHTSDCYTSERVLKCGQIESTGHKHGVDCYEPQKVLICTQTEGKPHKHTEQCYETKETLICKKPIHKHTIACESNPKSDVETAKDWEKTMSKVKLTGVWADDVLLIADSQLGYEESKKNYVVDPDGKKRGYSRFGAWYGDEYGHWCAMFVSFCLNYAEVDPKLLPYDCNCQNWIDVLSNPKLEYELYRDNEEYLPKPGDLIFFDWDSYDKEKEDLRHSDHVGLVYELLTEKDKDGNEIVTQIKTIEGNSSNKVRYVTYDIDDDRIMGYGEMPENPNYVEEETTAEETSQEETSAEAESETVIEEETVQEADAEMAEIPAETEAESREDVILPETEAPSEEKDAEAVEVPAETENEAMEEEILPETDAAPQPVDPLDEEMLETTEPENAPEMSESEMETEAEHFQDDNNEAIENEVNEFLEDTERTEMPLVKTFEGSDYIVHVTYTVDAEIPEDAELRAEEYSKTSRTYKERYAEAAELYGWTEDEDYTEVFRLFDIGFYKDGFLFFGNSEVEPMDKVSVSITLKQVNTDNEQLCQITHFGEEETRSLEAVAEVNGDEVTIDFDTESFSDYGVMLLAADDYGLSSEEDYGISLLAAADNEANLIAYFTFDNDGRGDSSGNGSTITFHGNEQYGFTTLAPGYTANDGIANPRSLKLAYATNSTNAYKTYATIAKSNGQPLLTGYKEISFDFWMYPEAKNTSTTGDTANGWPFAVMKSNAERTYLGMYNSANGGRAQAEKVYNGNYGGSATIANQDLNNKWTHVRIDFSDTEITETLWDANGNLIRTVTTPNTNPIADVLGSNSSVVIGGNTYYKEYFNGYIDEFKIYASGSSNSGQQTGSDYHVCRSDEIAHASFDNNTVTREETGKATITNYGAEVTTNSNIFAPVPVKQGNTKGAGLFWHNQNDYISITGSNNQSLIKGHGYNQFELDFWARPQSLTANTQYGLFTVGSEVLSSGRTRRYLAAYINGSDPTKVYLQSTNNTRTTTIQCTQSVSDKMLHYIMLYQNGNATLYILDADNNVLGSGSVATASFAALFENDEVVRFGVDADGNSFNGRLDEVMVTARNFSQTVADGTRHPASAKTGDLHSTGVYLLNVDLSAGNEGNPLAGVSYSIWSGTDTSGRPLGTYTTNELYMLNIPEGVLTPGQTYTIKQVGVPDGYMVVDQTTTFTVNSNNGDSLTEIGVFYDYKSGDGYDPYKKAEVVDYENRIYDIILSAKSGAVTPKIQKKKFLFVVDQSNSMLFPAKLESTGATVTLFHDNVPGFDEALHAGGNSARMDAALAEKNLDPSKLYYIICKENTTATVYVLYRSSNGDWYYQDASYYAQVQNPNVTGYEYADVGTGDNTRSKGGGGDLNGTNRVSENKGFALVGTLQDDIANSGVPAGIAGTKKTYTIYQAGMDNGQVYNRLTYLKYAIKRMVYELAEMDSQNEVTIVGFDKTIEGCITREVDKSHSDNVADLIKFVDDIDTTDQTSQNYGLWHIMGRNPTDMKDVEHSATYNHLADGTNAYVVLITDGALNCPGNTIESGVTQREDLYRAATAIRNTGAGLITIGLSVQNVTEAQTDLASINEGGIASPGMSFLDMDADELSNYLTNTLLGRLMEFDSVESTATIRDYISESFYPCDQNGNLLEENTWLKLDGTVATNAADQAGQLKHDDQGWYVEWKDQLLGLGTEGTPEIPGTPGTAVTSYVYTDQMGNTTTLDTDTIYYINYYWNMHIDGSGPYDQSQSMLLYRNDRWVYEFASNVWQPEHTDPYEFITTSTVGTPGTPTIPGTPGSPVWHGKIFVKAKEDFIGGNTIDTNKYDATISVKNSDGSSGGTISLETPTVNVRLLPLNEFKSEETVFLSDEIRVEDKIKAFEKLIYFTKIKTCTDNVQNKVTATGKTGNGLEGDKFYLKYAWPKNYKVAGVTLTDEAGNLTQDAWTKLVNGESLNLPYIYDDASSHGDVGYFTISITKKNEDDIIAPHESTEVGLNVEEYTLNIDYTAYRITGGGELDTREDNVHNYGNGPGFEVGSAPTTVTENGHEEQRGITVENGLGTLSSENVHLIHVVDGKVTVIKQINQALYDKLTKATDDSENTGNPLEFTFRLQKEETKTQGGVTTTEWVDVADSQFAIIASTPRIEDGKTVYEGIFTKNHLARGRYQILETSSTKYHVSSMHSVEDLASTNCEHSDYGWEDEPDEECTAVTFTIGEDLQGNDVIIWEDTENSEFFKIYSYLNGTNYEPGSDEACKGVSYEELKIINTITKEETEIPVNKTWHQVNDRVYEDLDVYVVLYQNGSAVLDKDNNRRVIRLNSANNWQDTFKNIPVPEEGKTIYEDGYTIRELDRVSTEAKQSDDYKKAVVENITVLDENGNQVHPYVWFKEAKESGNIHISVNGTNHEEGFEISGINEVKFEVIRDENQNQTQIVKRTDDQVDSDKEYLDGFEVTNTRPYILPETGGVGTTRYTLGGLALIAFSLLYGFYLRRERERRTM